MALIVILILNIISFSVHYDLSSSYWLSKINEEYFNIPYATPDTNGEESMQYELINVVEDIQDYLEIYFHDNFLSENASTTSDYLNDRKILYGPYRFHGVNIKSSE